MKTININDLREYLIDYITNFIRTLGHIDISDNEEFNNWAKNYDRLDAEVLVDMEFVVDWGYETRSEIPIEEAHVYGDKLIKIVLDNWYIGIDTY